MRHRSGRPLSDHLDEKVAQKVSRLAELGTAPAGIDRRALSDSATIADAIHIKLAELNWLLHLAFTETMRVDISLRHISPWGASIEQVAIDATVYGPIFAAAK